MGSEQAFKLLTLPGIQQFKRIGSLTQAEPKCPDSAIRRPAVVPGVTVIEECELQPRFRRCWVLADHVILV